MTAARILIVLAVLVPCSVAVAAPALPAKDVLANVQRRYAKVTHLRAEFRQVVTLSTFGTTTVSQGNLALVAPDHMRWDYKKLRNKAWVPERWFVFDGANLTVVDHKNREIRKQPVGDSPLPAALSFLTGGAALTTDFTFALSAASAADKLVVQLTPKSPSASIKQLDLVVDPTDWSVRESIVTAPNGDLNHITFTAPDLKSAVDASEFVIDPKKFPLFKRS